MHLEEEPPGHTDGPLERCQFRTVNPVKLPEEVAQAHIR